MAKQIIEARVKQKVDTESNWLNNELRLLDGEQAFVRTDAGVSVNFKIGDGNKTFSELPYFYPPLTLGSISTTQTLSQLNALADGVWVAMTAGRYANGLISKEGFFTTFRKVGNQWTINSETEVSFSGQDIDWIEAQLADHNQRITDNRSNIEYLTDYTWGKAQALTALSTRVDNLTESNIKIIGLYPTLDNPTTQSSFNRRLFNMVQNGLDNQSNFRTNTTNNVTSDFKIAASNWEMKQTNLGLVVISRGNEMTYENGFNWVSQDDERAYVTKDRIGGNTLGVDWSIRKVTGTTLPSNYILPANAQTRTLPISVNGNFADANGNIVVSGGSGGSYILPPATVSTLGGIKIGSGLTASEDGTVSVSGGGASYIAGLGITIDRNEISAKVDGTTITTNSSGQLVAIGGGGGGSFNPSSVNNVTNAFTLKAPNWELKNYQYGGAELNLGASSGVLFTNDNGIDYYNENGQLVVSPTGFFAESFIDNMSIGITPVAITVSEVEYSFPRNTTNRTLPISVNGNYADANGNITVTSGGSYTGAYGIQISGSNVITPTYGTTSNTVAQGNDSRFPTTAERTSWNNKLDKPTANAELASVVGFDAGGVSKKSEVVEIASSWTSGTAPTSTQLTDSFPNAMFVLAVNLTVPKMYIKSGGGWKSVNLETVV